jgi:hypothetical protein
MPLMPLRALRALRALMALMPLGLFALFAPRAQKNSAPVTGVSAAREAGEERCYLSIYGTACGVFRVSAENFSGGGGR